MNEQVSPGEERMEYPERTETPTERVQEMATEIRRRAESLGTVVTERAKELGDVAGERTRGAVEQVRYFSEEARTEAAARLEGTGHYLSGQFDEAQAYTRETVRQHPGMAVSLAAITGFLLALFSRRFLASMWRR